MMTPDDARLLARAMWADRLVAQGGSETPDVPPGPMFPYAVFGFGPRPRSFIVALTDSPRPYRAYVDCALVWPIDGGRN